MSGDTHQEIAAECERKFQAGGPKVYIRSPNGRLEPSQHSGRRSVQLAFKGESVYARRKYGREYRWIKVGVGS